MPNYDEIVREILENNTLMTVATTNNGKPWASTVFYAYTKELDLVFLSEPSTRHGLALAKNEAVALSIYDSKTQWGEKLRGLQIEGTASAVSLLNAPKLFSIYLERFLIAQKLFPSVDTLFGKFKSRPFLVKPTCIKIYDEKNLGPEGTYNYELA